MDSNKAFADHWDKKNPSAHVQACNHSRQLMEEAQREREKKQKQAELDKIAVQKMNEQDKIALQNWLNYN